MPDKIVQVDGLGTVAFPDTMNDQDIAAAIRKQQVQQPSPGGTATQIFQEAAPRYAASALPVAGSFLGPEGTVAGSLASQALRTKFPNVFGEGPSDLGEAALNVGTDLLGQNIIPGVLGKVGGLVSNFIKDVGTVGPKAAAMKIGGSILSSRPFSWNPAVQTAITDAKLAPKVFPETGILESAAANVNDVTKDFIDKFTEAKDIGKVNPFTGLTPQQSQIWQEYSNTVGKNNVGKSLLRLNADVENGGSVAAQQSYKKITNNVLSDVSQVRNFKLATGEDDTVRQLAQSQLIEQSFSNDKTFNPDVALKELTGPKNEIYKEAMGDNYGTFKTFLDGLPKTGNAVNTTISYLKHRLIFSLPWLLEGGSHAIEGGLATTGAIILTDKGISKLMENPQMAKAVVLASKMPPTKPEATMLGRMILYGMRGTDAYLNTPEGQEKVTIGPNGEIQYPK